MVRGSTGEMIPPRKERVTQIKGRKRNEGGERRKRGRRRRLRRRGENEKSERERRRRRRKRKVAENTGNQRGRRIVTRVIDQKIKGMLLKSD